jgi:hypothetical protein
LVCKEEGAAEKSSDESINQSVSQSVSQSIIAEAGKRAGMEALLAWWIGVVAYVCMGKMMDGCKVRETRPAT